MDLLPDREAETSAAWMRQQPDLMAVSRDRGGAYASAAAQGAPQAMQCADRFHLQKNLGEAVEGLLAHHLARERKEQTQARRDEHTTVWRPKRAARPSPKLERLQHARREERLARYEQVMALRNQGLSHQAIAELVGVGHSTVSRWAAAETFPERKPREQTTRLDRYLPYLCQRWSEGCHTIACLFRELVEQGYQGSYSSVRDHLVRLLPAGRKHAPDPSPKAPALPTPRQAAFLLLRRPETLRAEEQETLMRLRQMSPEVDLAYGLVQQFGQMLRTRTGERLDAWLTEAGTWPSSRTPVLCSWDRERQRRRESWSHLVDQ